MHRNELNIIVLKSIKMKKIPNNESIKLSPVKMYWDDLQEINERIMKGREIEVESGEHKYESLEELKEKTKKNYISQVKITGRSEKFNNYINVNIEPGEVWIHQDSESTETAAKVRELLTNNSPWYMYSLNSPGWCMLKGVLGWIPIFTFPFFSLRIKNIYLSLIMFLIGVGILLWTFKYEPILGRSKIFTCLRKDNLNFWERNKDQLLRELIIALIAGIIGFLFSRLLPK